MHIYKYRTHTSFRIIEYIRCVCAICTCSTIAQFSLPPHTIWIHTTRRWVRTNSFPFSCWLACRPHTHDSQEYIYSFCLQSPLRRICLFLCLRHAIISIRFLCMLTTCDDNRRTNEKRRGQSSTFSCESGSVRLTCISMSALHCRRPALRLMGALAEPIHTTIHAVCKIQLFSRTLNDCGICCVVHSETPREVARERTLECLLFRVLQPAAGENLSQNRLVLMNVPVNIYVAYTLDLGV